MRLSCHGPTPHARGVAVCGPSPGQPRRARLFRPGRGWGPRTTGRGRCSGPPTPSPGGVLRVSGKQTGRASPFLCPLQCPGLDCGSQPRTTAPPVPGASCSCAQSGRTLPAGLRPGPRPPSVGSRSPWVSAGPRRGAEEADQSRSPRSWPRPEAPGARHPDPGQLSPWSLRSLGAGPLLWGRGWGCCRRQVPWGSFQKGVWGGRPGERLEHPATRPGTWVLRTSSASAWAPACPAQSSCLAAPHPGLPPWEDTPTHTGTHTRVRKRALAHARARSADEHMCARACTHNTCVHTCVWVCMHTHCNKGTHFLFGSLAGSPASFAQRSDTSQGHLVSSVQTTEGSLGPEKGPVPRNCGQARGRAGTRPVSCVYTAWAWRPPGPGALDGHVCSESRLQPQGSSSRAPAPPCPPRPPGRHPGGMRGRAV